MKKKYDILIVGAGFFGATYARIATDLGKKCIVIDKLPYVGGTASDIKINNIYVCNYGAHIFHTNSEIIWKFLNQFAKFNNFINKPKAISKNKIWSFPINLMTLNQLWGISTPAEALKKLKEVCIPCKNPKNFEQWALSKVGEELYYLFYYNYTKKQWFKEPKNLPLSIITRLPIKLVYDENYFSTTYQGMPIEGYTNLIKNMLFGIDLELGIDFFDLDWKKYAQKIVYSGSLDKLFNYQFGKLDYRTLDFEQKVINGDYQGNAVINYCDGTEKYIRSVEHKHFYKIAPKHYQEDNSKSVITYDIPVPYAEDKTPFYPITDSYNLNIYNKYKKIAICNNIIIGGRLGSYKYVDIDQVCAEAIQMAQCQNY